MNESKIRPETLKGETPVSRYVVLTAAYNEAKFIERVIQAVISQTVLPVRWVIVSDGSTDHTDEIVRRFSASFPFIQLLRVDSTQARGVIRKVNALNLAYREAQHSEHEFVANLDADVSFDNRYFETLLDRFGQDQTLGISGGLIHEERGGRFQSRLSNNVRSVAHAAQLVRRACYEAIGGYHAMKYGGEDWCAEVNARMRGWRVLAFADLEVLHHRPTGTADRMMRHFFRQGMMDYSVGSYPAFEILKCLRRIPEWPAVIGALTRLGGFFWACVQREPREVSPEFMSFLRDEQKQRLKLLFGGFPPLGRRLVSR